MQAAPTLKKCFCVQVQQNKQSTWLALDLENLQDPLPRMVPDYDGNGTSPFNLIDMKPSFELFCNRHMVFQIPHHNLTIQSCKPFGKERQNRLKQSWKQLGEVQLCNISYKPDVLNRFIVPSRPFVNGTMQLTISRKYYSKSSTRAHHWTYQNRDKLKSVRYAILMGTTTRL